MKMKSQPKNQPNPGPGGYHLIIDDEQRGPGLSREDANYWRRVVERNAPGCYVVFRYTPGPKGLAK